MWEVGRLGHWPIDGKQFKFWWRTKGGPTACALLSTAVVKVALVPPPVSPYSRFPQRKWRILNSNQ